MCLRRPREKLSRCSGAGWQLKPTTFEKHFTFKKFRQLKSQVLSTRGQADVIHLHRLTEDDAGDLSPFAHPGAVADHESGARAVGHDLLVLLARVQHPFELELAQLATF